MALVVVLRISKASEVEMHSRQKATYKLRKCSLMRKYALQDVICYANSSLLVYRKRSEDPDFVVECSQRGVDG